MELQLRFELYMKGILFCEFKYRKITLCIFYARFSKKEKFSKAILYILELYVIVEWY